MANQRRHAHYARTGRQLTPRTSHPGTPTAQTPHVDAPRYTIPDYLRGHRAGTQHALSQDFRILTIEVEEPPQLSMKVSFSEDVKFEGKGEFSQLSAIKSSIRDLVAVGHSRSIKKGQIIGVAAVIAFLLTITITTVLQTLN